MVKVTLKLNQSVDQNASVYFEKAKKAKKKIDGLKIALKKSYTDLAKVETQIEKEVEERIVEESKVIRKKEWYEKFRWFFTSTGFLVLGGRDATTNEIVIKKHTDKGDIVYHTDMAGSPFFVIKADGKKLDEKTLREGADATCTFSRAFKLGLQSQSVFYVNPEQVTKEANAGEFLTKGSFMIRGKTNYIENKVNCAIGKMKDGKIMCGPIDAVKKHCKNLLIIEQGEGKPSDIAKIIKKKLDTDDLDEIIRALPSGGIAIKK